MDGVRRMGSKRMNRTLWWMVTGTGITQTTQFMVMPFVALYMTAKTGAAPGLVGLAIGMNALTTTLLSFFGGALADRIGRRPMMSMAMLVNAIAMTGFVFAHTVPVFFAVSAMAGLARALFGPASQAMMTDLTEASDRSRAFALNYWMNNIGASLGPLLGGYFGNLAGGTTFYAAAGVSFIYAIVIATTFPETVLQKRTGTTQNRIFVSLQTIRRDKALAVFITASVLTSLAYAQFDTTLPQVMKTMMGTSHAAHAFGLIFAVTGIEVVLFQFIMNRLADFLPTAVPFVASQLVYSLSFLGFGIAHTFVGYLCFGILLTVGEMVAAPRMAQYVSMIADERWIGAYFGASSLANLGYFLGPFLGGVLLRHIGDLGVFSVMSVVTLIAAPMYFWSHRVYRRRESR